MGMNDSQNEINIREKGGEKKTMAKGNPNSNYPTAKLSQVPGVGEYSKRFSEIMKLPPCRKCDPTEIKQRIEMMFKYCEENDRRPTVELLSVFVGVSRTTLWQWEQDEDSEAGRIVERAKAAINAIITEIGFSGAAPYQFVIWNQKNNYGYKDVVELLPGNKNIDNLPDKEKIIKSLPKQLECEADLDLEDILGDE